MRYQELIYIQNENSGVRNKDILNANMSSDICIFEAPLFNVSGATKIDCTGSTGTTYVVTTATTIPLTFNFTGNVGTFTASSATFKYEIYKYSNVSGVFSQPATYKSEQFSYSAFSGTNIINETVPVSSLNLDGDYLIKGFYQFSACTEFIGKLGKIVDTSSFINGSEYGIYDSNLDYYFIAFKGADKPLLAQNNSNNAAANQLFQQVILAKRDQTDFIIDFNYGGTFIVTLNGLTLAPYLDYTYSGNVVTLSDATVIGDVVTIIYTTTGGNNLTGDVIKIADPIVSGVTDGQGMENVYFNTTTSKYEVYTSVSPAIGGSILIMLNGVTLANGVDYYQSISKRKRIIMEGNLSINDIVTIVYFPLVSAINGLIVNTPTISWSISNPPQNNLGVFTLEDSTGTSFTTLYSSSSQPYVINNTYYADTFTASGTVGTTLYYRVKNEKNYETLCGQILTDIAYSETIPVIIQTNAINSY